MKKMLYFSLFVLVLGCRQSSQQFPQFSYHTIDNIGSRMGQTDLADIDNDGDLDWVTAEAPWSGDTLAWWLEYQAPDVWVRHQIGKANSDVGGDCYDINGDGWIDFWGGTLLFLNRGDGSFSRHEIGTIFSHDSQFEEIDGDGTMDGVANWDKYGLVWYSIPVDPTQKWIEHIVAEKPCHEAVAGDVDGDGDIDICSKPWSTGNEHFYLQNLLNF